MNCKGATEDAASHLMHTAILAPPAECLTLEVKQDTKETPERDECTVCHDGRYKSGLHDQHLKA